MRLTVNRQIIAIYAEQNFGSLRKSKPYSNDKTIGSRARAAEAGAGIPVK